MALDLLSIDTALGMFVDLPAVTRERTERRAVPEFILDAAAQLVDDGPFYTHPCLLARDVVKDDKRSIDPELASLRALIDRKLGRPFHAVLRKTASGEAHQMYVGRDPAWWARIDQKQASQRG